MIKHAWPLTFSFSLSLSFCLSPFSLAPPLPPPLSIYLSRLHPLHLELDSVNFAFFGDGWVTTSHQGSPRLGDRSG